MVLFFQSTWRKGQEEGDRVEPADWLCIVFFVCFFCCCCRGGGCSSTTRSGTPPGHALHEAAASGQTEGRSATSQGQRALQRALQTVPSSGHPPLLWPQSPGLWPRRVAGEDLPGGAPGRGDSAPHRHRIPWRMGHQTPALLPARTPVCERGGQTGGEAGCGLLFMTRFRQWRNVTLTKDRTETVKRVDMRCSWFKAHVSSTLWEYNWQHTVVFFLTLRFVFHLFNTWACLSIFHNTRWWNRTKVHP